MTRLSERELDALEAAHVEHKHSSPRCDEGCFDGSWCDACSSPDAYPCVTARLVAQVRQLRLRIARECGPIPNPVEPSVSGLTREELIAMARLAWEGREKTEAEVTKLRAERDEAATKYGQVIDGLRAERDDLRAFLTPAAIEERDNLRAEVERLKESFRASENLRHEGMAREVKAVVAFNRERQRADGLEAARTKYYERTKAQEARLEEARRVLVGVAHRADDGGCWCDAFESAFAKHLPHCEIARAFLKPEAPAVEGEGAPCEAPHYPLPHDENCPRPATPPTDAPEGGVVHAIAGTDCSIGVACRECYPKPKCVCSCAFGAHGPSGCTDVTGDGEPCGCTAYDPDAPEGGSRERDPYKINRNGVTEPPRVQPLPKPVREFYAEGPSHRLAPEPPSRHAFVDHDPATGGCLYPGQCHHTTDGLSIARSHGRFCLKPASDPAHLPERQEELVGKFYEANPALAIQAEQCGDVFRCEVVCQGPRGHEQPHYYASPAGVTTKWYPPDWGLRAPQPVEERDR